MCSGSMFGVHEVWQVLFHMFLPCAEWVGPYGCCLSPRQQEVHVSMMGDVESLQKVLTNMETSSAKPNILTDSVQQFVDVSGMSCLSTQPCHSVIFDLSLVKLLLPPPSLLPSHSSPFLFPIPLSPSLSPFFPPFLLPFKNSLLALPFVIVMAAMEHS